MRSVLLGVSAQGHRSTGNREGCREEAAPEGEVLKVKGHQAR